MSLHMLPTTPAAEPSATGTFPEYLIYDVLPASALWAGLMAVIWIACAAITLAGAFTGTVVVAAIRTMAQSCANYLRRRWDVADAQPVTADKADGAQATIIDFESYRQSRESAQSEDADGRFRGDDQA